MNSKIISDKFTKVILFIIPLAVCAVYFLFNFLEVEDSYLYFSRVNYLEGPIFVFYNGHIQFLSQLVAYLLGFMSPFMQALSYSLFSVSSFMLMIFLLFKLVNNKYLVIIFISYLAIFFSVIFYNLANSIWSGLLISALIPYYLLKKEEEAKPYLVALAFIFALSFPLTILAAPFYIALFVKGQSRIFSTFMVLWLIIISLFLTNWDSSRTDMFLNLSVNFGSILSNPLNFFIPDLLLKSDLPSRLAEFTIFLGLIVIFLFKIYKKNLDLADFCLFLFSIVVFLLAFVSKTQDSFFMGPRYFLPSMMAFVIFIDSFLKDNGRFIKSISFLSLFFITISIYERYFPINEKKIEDISFLIQGFNSKIKVDRGGGWIIPLQEKNYHLSSCEKIMPDPNQELFIFCSDQLGEIPYKSFPETNK